MLPGTALPVDASSSSVMVLLPLLLPLLLLPLLLQVLLQVLPGKVASSSTVDASGGGGRWVSFISGTFSF